MKLTEIDNNMDPKTREQRIGAIKKSIDSIPSECIPRLESVVSSLHRKTGINRKDLHALADRVPMGEVGFLLNVFGYLAELPESGARVEAHRTGSDLHIVIDCIPEIYFPPADSMLRDAIIYGEMDNQSTPPTG